MSRVLISALLFLPCVPTFAQEMAPPKEVTDLGWMVGTWSGSGKVPYEGKEIELSVMMTFSIDGQFLKSKSSMVEGGMKMSETMMLGWSGAKSEYVSYSFTSFAPTPGIKHGKLDGANLVMTSEPWEVSGMTVVSRTTYTKLSDTKFRTKMEFKNGEKWDNAMELELTQK
ncbi:MAG: DUF1579 family protein [Armatimonadetes bacterium]|nr:DUF1579 family protein [Armatimonadota bacterium]